MKIYEIAFGVRLTPEEAPGTMPTAVALVAAGPAPPVSLNPSTGALPGSNVLQTIANGIGSWALIAAMVGVVVGAVLWAFGHYSQNYQQSYNGRKGVMVSGLAALLIGAAPRVITFFVNQGHTVR